MLKRISILGSLLAAVVMLGAPSSFAAKYGMAGCGLGSLVFEDQPGMIQIVAATLNGTGIQTFGITTGTSNCTDSWDETAALFVTINHDALQKEISQGQGEVVKTLAQIYQCDDATGFAATLKSSYGKIYPVESMRADETSIRIRKVIETNSSLSRTCKVFS